LGGAVGYFDKNDIFAFAPPESGKIAPAQIKNSSGHLIEGFTSKQERLQENPKSPL